MEKPTVLVVLTQREADYLEDLLDDESWRLGQNRRPGAGPGRKEKLLNSISEEVVYASAVAPQSKR